MFSYHKHIGERYQVTTSIRMHCVFSETRERSIESTINCLLKFPLFDVHRELLMDIVCPNESVLPNISDDSSVTNILLYGSNALNPTQNKEILNATLEHIQKIGRFAS